MDTFQKVILSGSTNGIGIPINSTNSGSANTIHTADSTSLDELWISFSNTSNSDATVTLAIGGISTSNLISLTIPSGRGLVPAISGLTFTGGVTIKAFSSITGAIVAYGFCNRIVTI